MAEALVFEFNNFCINYVDWELLPRFYIDNGVVYLYHVSVCLILLSIYIWALIGGILLPVLVSNLRDYRVYSRVLFIAKKKKYPIKYIKRFIKKSKIKNGLLNNVVISGDTQQYDTFFWKNLYRINTFFSYFFYLIFFLLSTLQLLLFFILSYSNSINYFFYADILGNDELKNIYSWHVWFYFYLIIGLLFAYFFSKNWDLSFSFCTRDKSYIYYKILSLKTMFFFLFCIIFKLSSSRILSFSVIDVDVFIYWDLLLFLSSLFINSRNYFIFRKNRSNNSKLDELYILTDTFRLRPTTDCYIEPHPDFYSLVSSFKYWRPKYLKDVHIRKYSGTHYQEMKNLCKIYKTIDKDWKFDANTRWPFTTSNHPNKAVSCILERYLSGRWKFDFDLNYSKYGWVRKLFRKSTTPFTKCRNSVFFLNYGDKFSGVVNGFYFHTFLTNLITLTTISMYIFIFVFSQTKLINKKSFTILSHIFLFFIVFIGFLKILVLF